MTEYQIQANTRRCSVTGQELRAGERFFSILVDEAGKFLRKDFSEQAWQGPPKDTFSFWCGRVPANDDNRKRRFDEDLLLDCFQRLDSQTDERRLNFRYVVALMLMRCRRLKFEEARTEDGHEYLYLRCARTRAAFRVLNPRLTDEQMSEVQDEVFKVLGWE